METSLHQQLKRIYAGRRGHTEVALGAFRIDAVVRRRGAVELVEIQHGPLLAIRDKIQRLVADHRVRIVKPIIEIKQLVKRDGKGGAIIGQRQSPRRGQFRELFSELLYFTRVFPHPNLTIEAVLVEIEEWRYPPPRRGRFARRRFMIEDQKLLGVRHSLTLRTAADLRQLVPCPLPKPFHTAHLAAGLKTERWQAQQIAYVLRKSGAIVAVGKQRGAWLYNWNMRSRSRRAA